VEFKEYWEKRAQAGTWGPLYERRLDARNYNFITRRAGVRQLLEGDGKFERMLDVGCGTGDYFELAALHDSSYHGMDFSPTMVEEAVRRVDGHGKHHLLVVGAGENLPYEDNSFDLVTAIGYIEYIPDPLATIREIRRVLKPGGVLVMQAFKPDLFCTVDRVLMNRLLSMYRRLRGGKRAAPAPGVNHYSQRRLDGMLAPYGFERTDYRFNNFFVMPRFLQLKFPNVYIRLSEALTKSNSTFWSFLAVNYIGRYSLKKTAPRQERAGGVTAGMSR
jgi:ubiquinone/menaquinone biosynthesis C-methylase UbiE